MSRWRGWWRIVRADQWGVYFVGALLGMALPALLYVTFIPAGTDIRGLGIAAALADALVTTRGALIGGIVALLGAWILLKTQLDILDGVTRAITDNLWTGSRRLRRAGADVRFVYYGVLGAVVIWGVIACSRSSQRLTFHFFGSPGLGVQLPPHGIPLRLFPAGSRRLFGDPRRCIFPRSEPVKVAAQLMSGSEELRFHGSHARLE